MSPAGFQLAQLLIPLAEELIPVLVGMFQHHAPQASVSIEAMEAAKENFAADAADPIKAALAKAIMTPPPVEETPKKTGVVFHGNEPRPI